jgi:hypothetical protein
MTLQELQDNALELTIADRWQLISSLMRSVRSNMPSTAKPQGLAASLIGIAKTDAVAPTDDEVMMMLEERRIGKYL